MGCRHARSSSTARLLTCAADVGCVGGERGMELLFRALVTAEDAMKGQDLTGLRDEVVFRPEACIEILFRLLAGVVTSLGIIQFDRAQEVSFARSFAACGYRNSGLCSMSCQSVPRPSLEVEAKGRGIRTDCARHEREMLVKRLD